MQAKHRELKQRNRGLVLGARLIQGFLSHPDERAKGMLVCVFAWGRLGKVGAGAGNRPSKELGFGSWEPGLSPQNRLEL